MTLFDLNGYTPSVCDLAIHLLPGLLIYQLLGAIRHILSHVVAYSAAGYRISELRLYPHTYHQQFYWSYYRAVAQGGAKYNAMVELGPYVVAALEIVSWAFVMLLWPNVWSVSVQLSWHIKMVFTMLFMVSPAVDLMYNLIKLMFRRGDLYRALMRWKVYP